MAQLENLIRQITDASLREKLELAILELKRRRPFGIIFEEHIPEVSALPGMPVQIGNLVEKRKDSGGQRWKVKDILKGGKKVVLIPEEGGNEENVEKKNIIVIKRFGDPIYPNLTPIERIIHEPDKPVHAIINGENFHALQLLMFQFEGQIDCIYIDPPYNTGARDWKYNNRYVDSNDTYRHSKWLSMIEKRLKIAKRLLRRDGVLICTIDEHEVHHLGMLLEKLFPDYLRYMVTTVINPKGTAKANLARVDEYIFFIVPDIGQEVLLPRPLITGSTPTNQTILEIEEDDNENNLEEEIEENPENDDESPNEDDIWEYRHARRRGSESSYRIARPGQFYPIYVDEKGSEVKVIRVGDIVSIEDLPLDEKTPNNRVNGLRPVWPVDNEGRHRVWGFKPSSMQARIDNGNVFVGKHHPGNNSYPYTLNYRVPKKNTRKVKTVWCDSRHDAGTHGTQLVRKLLGQPGLFPFPKSLYVVRDALDIVVRNRPNAIILDFFAGSGTTFHATCLLNSEDGGKRRCILVTNNEVADNDVKSLNEKGYFRGDPKFEQHGIFEQVTRPRCKAVVNGLTPDGDPIEGRYLDLNGKSRGPYFKDGFKENIEFFEMNYLDHDEIDLGHQFGAIVPILWLAAGGVGKRDEKPKPNAFYSIPDGAKYGVLFKESRFEVFRKALKNRSELTHIWLVTDSEEAFTEMCSNLPPGLRISMLYRDYLRNFEINTERTL